MACGCLDECLIFTKAVREWLSCATGLKWLMRGWYMPHFNIFNTCWWWDLHVLAFHNFCLKWLFITFLILFSSLADITTSSQTSWSTWAVSVDFLSTVLQYTPSHWNSPQGSCLALWTLVIFANSLVWPLSSASYTMQKACKMSLNNKDVLKDHRNRERNNLCVIFISQGLMLNIHETEGWSFDKICYAAYFLHWLMLCTMIQKENLCLSSAECVLRWNLLL